MSLIKVAMAHWFCNPIYDSLFPIREKKITSMHNKHILKILTTSKKRTIKREYFMYAYIALHRLTNFIDDWTVMLIVSLLSLWWWSKKSRSLCYNVISLWSIVFFPFELSITFSFQSIFIASIPQFQIIYYFYFESFIRGILIFT